MIIRKCQAHIVLLIIVILLFHPPTMIAGEIAATITAYCLNSSTTSGPTPREILGRHGRPCIALSRPLARAFGLKSGPGQYDYRFGCTIEVTGAGRFIFADLMPSKWTGYRVDIWMPSAAQCWSFGVKRLPVKVVEGAFSEKGHD